MDRPNYVFENEGDLTFTDRTDAWTNAAPGLSNGAAVADLDNDGDLDVVTNNIDDPATLLENQAEDALPSIRTPGSVVTAADYDGDGQSDLFVGGRVRPRAYPRPPRSHLLRNESEGDTVAFADVTHTAAPGLTKPGLVTAEVGLGETAGWWLSLAAEDIDGDGTPEYVAGNLGRNTRHEASPSAPMRVYAKDYDGNGTIDPVLTHVVDGTRYPLPRRDRMLEQIPGLKARVPTYRAYAEAPLDAVFTAEERAALARTGRPKRRIRGSFCSGSPQHTSGSRPERPKTGLGPAPMSPALRDRFRAPFPHSPRIYGRVSPGHANS